MTQHKRETRPSGAAFLRRSTSHLHTLILAAFLLVAGTFVVLPDSAEAREKPQQQTRTSSPPARTSTPPARTSTPPARTSTPPARTSTPPARTATPRAKPSPPPDRASSSSSSSSTRRAPETRGNDGVTYGGSRARGTQTRRDTPSPRDRGDRVLDRTTSHDRRGYSGDEHRYGDRDRYHSGHRSHRGGHVHTPYCGHRYYGRGGYGHGYGHGHVHHRYCGHWPYYSSYYRYSWYWPWWPTIYVGAESHRDHDSGAMDLDVRPEEAQIFLDGQYVGVADDYDGFPTYLWLKEGTYDVAFYHPGYETIFRQVSIYPGVVIDFEDRMRPGEAIHPDEYGPSSTVRRDARIQRNREKEAAARRAEARRDEWDDVTYGAPSGSSSAPSAEGTATSPAPTGDKIGRLYVAVLPTDTAVYLDGHFLGTAGELGQLSAGLVVEPGDHVVELVRPGYATAREKVTVPPGEKVAIERELREE